MGHFVRIIFTLTCVLVFTMQSESLAIKPTAALEETKNPTEVVFSGSLPHQKDLVILPTKDEIESQSDVERIKRAPLPDPQHGGYGHHGHHDHGHGHHGHHDHHDHHHHHHHGHGHHHY